MRELIPLIFVPFSLIAATAVGWKFARVAGWWLMIGGIAMAMTIPFVIASVRRGGGGWADLFWTFLFPAVFPMLAAGGLWLLYDSKARRADPTRTSV